AWLRRTTARLEPENQRQRQQRCWDQRSVRITHDDDGTAQLFSVLSSEDGIAIDDLINQLARQRAQNTDGVTIQQARADIIADLLLGRTSLDGQTTGSTRVQARIAVTIPISTLAGWGEQPAISIDGQTALSAAAVRELAALPAPSSDACSPTRPATTSWNAPVPATRPPRPYAKPSPAATA